MAASYPTSIKSFTAKVAGDTVQPEHVVALQDEVTAIETQLLTGGTWTPTIGGSGGQSGQVYSFQVGHYMRIGKLVHATFNVSLSTLGTITTIAQIQGLPFTIENLGANYAPTTTTLYWSGMTSSFVTLVGIGVQNATTINLYGATAAATGLTSLAQANLSATTQIAGSILYRTT